MSDERKLTLEQQLSPLATAIAAPLLKEANERIETLRDEVATLRARPQTTPVSELDTRWQAMVARMDERLKVFAQRGETLDYERKRADEMNAWLCETRTELEECKGMLALNGTLVRSLTEEFIREIHTAHGLRDDCAKLQTAWDELNERTVVQYEKLEDDLRFLLTLAPTYPGVNVPIRDRLRAIRARFVHEGPTQEEKDRNR